MGGSAKYRAAKQAKNRRQDVGRNQRTNSPSKQNPYNINRGIIRRTMNRFYDEDKNLMQNLMTPEKELDHMRNYKDMMKNEPQITQDVQRIANMINAPLLGFEKRRKSIKSATEKYDRLLLSNKNTNTEMNDSVRYTNEVNIDTFGRDVNKALDAYKEAGYNVKIVKNFWTKPWAYKGINVTMENKAGKLFEVQFHTKNSFQVKDGPMHKLYNVQRKYKQGSKQYEAVEKEMLDLSRRLIKTPNGVDTIKNLNWF